MVSMAVKYKGSLYVSASHKKCEDGTHWNLQKGKCLKLPPKALEKHKTAMSLSTKAHKLSDKAVGINSLDQHHKAYTAHVAADKAHADAASSAWQHGFESLGNKHDTLSKRHDMKASAHANHVSKHFKGHLA